MTVSERTRKLKRLHSGFGVSSVCNFFDYFDSLMFIKINLFISQNFIIWRTQAFSFSSSQELFFTQLHFERSEFLVGRQPFFKFSLSIIQQSFSPMRPNPFPSSNGYTGPSSYQQSNYVPYQLPKPNQIRQMNFQPYVTPGSTFINPPSNTDSQSKKISTVVTQSQQRKEGNTPMSMPTFKPTQERKEGSNTPVAQPRRITKPAFLNANREHHNSDTGTSSMNDSQNLRREESEPDLRTTCPNVFKKIQQQQQSGYNREREAPMLRYTTNANVGSKLGAVMNEAKKYDEEQQQKAMKKNSGLATEQHHNMKLESPYKSMTDSKKLPEKPNFKSLNQIWSNKERGAVKVPKKNLINGFEVYKQLGKGKFGQVYLARHAETGFIVALKKIIKAKVVEYKMIEQFKREIKLHSALDHPNIVKFFGFFEEGQNIYLILEYISGGTLFEYASEKEMLSPKEAAEFLKDTIQALSYMHDRSIAHRDIKPENIVLTAQKVAKLCDFGWSALVQSSRTTYCGTFDYAPPEILERKNYDTAVDMWCIGVLAFELLTGRVPFEGEKRKQIMEKIISVDKQKIIYPVEIPEDAKSFIEQLVQKDPTQRPKCKDLLHHPFIVNNTKKPAPNPKDKKF